MVSGKATKTTLYSFLTSYNFTSMVPKLTTCEWLFVIDF